MITNHIFPAGTALERTSLQSNLTACGQLVVLMTRAAAHLAHLYAAHRTPELPTVLALEPIPPEEFYLIMIRR